MLDVAIAGGGPAGLAMANSLLSALPGVQIQVYEAAPEFIIQGAGVLMNLNGQHALEAINPALYERMRAVSVSVQGMKNFRLDGSVRRERQAGAFGEEFMQKYNKSMFFLGWAEIRNTLYEMLPPGIVTFDHKAVGVEETEHGARLLFQGGQPSVEARIVVGADGYFSRVRRAALGPEDPPPQFLNTVMWRARFGARDYITNEHTSWWTGAEKPQAFQHSFAVLFPINDGQFTFVLAAPMTDLQKHGLGFDPSPSRIKSIQDESYKANNLERCMKIFTGYPEVVQRLLRETDPSTVTEHGLFQRPVDSITAQNMGRGRITLVGDAAHSAPPNGQGVNLSMEDACALAWHIQQGGLNEDSLRRAEAERAVRVVDVITKGADDSEGPIKEELIFNTRFRPLKETAHSDWRDRRSSRVEPTTFVVKPRQPVAASAEHIVRAARPVRPVLPRSGLVQARPVLR